MKISELRALLDRTATEDMKRFVVELYRALPKKTRECLAIDELLKNPATSRADAKRTKALAQSVNIDDVAAELEQFLIDAYAQNYFAPNRFVPKSERPKWRFKVKRFFKEINAAVVEPGSTEKASDLLEKLYQVLCYACDTVIFSGDDPFQSTGITQTAFLDAVLALKAEHLELDKFICHGLNLVISSRLNRYTLGSNLVHVLVDRLRTPESLELAIERATQLSARARSAPDGKQGYYRSDPLNRLAEFGLLANVKLSDYDKAIDFFNANYSRRDPEVTLFVLLNWLRALKREDLWQREFERAVQAGVQPRDSLSSAYRHLRSEGQLPGNY